MFFIWLVIFLCNKNLRKEMLIASLIATPAALSEFFFVPEYWYPDAIISPKLSIEDFLFSFAVGGIAAVLYELVVRRVKHKRLCDCLHESRLPVLVLLVGVVVVFITYFIFRINFMIAAYIGILTDLSLMVLTRPDLTRKLLLSSLLFGLFYTLFFALFTVIVPGFTAHWNPKALSGLTFLKVPIEEILWGFGAGGLFGPIYEYLLGISITKSKSV